MIWPTSRTGRSESNGIPGPADMMLNGLKLIQQNNRLQNGFYFDNIIYKPVLVFIIDRFGLVNR